MVFEYNKQDSVYCTSTVFQILYSTSTVFQILVQFQYNLNTDFVYLKKLISHQKITKIKLKTDYWIFIEIEMFPHLVVWSFPHSFTVTSATEDERILEAASRSSGRIFVYSLGLNLIGAPALL